MRFRRGAKLDPGQVTDVRGRRMAPGGLAVGGGGLGIAAVVIYLLITVLSGGDALGELAPLDQQQVQQGDAPSEVSQECQTSEDANERQDCRIVGVVNSVQRFWGSVFERSNREYQFANTVFFTDQVQTGCGLASSRSGRSTVHGTSASTSTSISSTSCSHASAQAAGPSRRRTSSRTSTATTFRT